MPLTTPTALMPRHLVSPKRPCVGRDAVGFAASHLGKELNPLATVFDAEHVHANRERAAAITSDADTEHKIRGCSRISPALTVCLP